MKRDHCQFFVLTLFVLALLGTSANTAMASEVVCGIDAPCKTDTFGSQGTGVPNTANLIHLVNHVLREGPTLAPCH